MQRKEGNGGFFDQAGQINAAYARQEALARHAASTLRTTIMTTDQFTPELAVETARLYYGYTLQGVSLNLSRTARISELDTSEIGFERLDYSQLSEEKLRLEQAFTLAQQGDYTGLAAYAREDGAALSQRGNLPPEGRPEEYRAEQRMLGAKLEELAARIPPQGKPLSQPLLAWEDPTIINDYEQNGGQPTGGGEQ